MRRDNPVRAFVLAHLSVRHWHFKLCQTESVRWYLEVTMNVQNIMGCAQFRLQEEHDSPLNAVQMDKFSIVRGKISKSFLCWHIFLIEV